VNCVVVNCVVGNGVVVGFIVVVGVIVVDGEYDEVGEYDEDGWGVTILLLVFGIGVVVIVWVLEHAKYPLILIVILDGHCSDVIDEYTVLPCKSRQKHISSSPDP